MNNVIQMKGGSQKMTKTSWAALVTNSIVAIVVVVVVVVVIVNVVDVALLVVTDPIIFSCCQ